MDSDNCVIDCESEIMRLRDELDKAYAVIRMQEYDRDCAVERGIEGRLMAEYRRGRDDAMVPRYEQLTANHASAIQASIRSQLPDMLDAVLSPKHREVFGDPMNQLRPICDVDIFDRPDLYGQTIRTTVEFPGLVIKLASDLRGY